MDGPIEGFQIYGGPRAESSRHFQQKKKKKERKDKIKDKKLWRKTSLLSSFPFV
jgi:hypothetical protein